MDIKMAVRRRKVLNVSLPLDLYAYVEETVRETRYASKSEFLRHLVRLYREKKLRGHYDKTIAERREEGRLKMKSHFQDVELLAKLLARSLPKDESDLPEFDDE